MVNQGHWIGMKTDPDRYFGFVYRIDVLETGKSYIGKRQLWVTRRGAKHCKSKVADRGSTRWKESCWVESDWQYYKGSSKYLAKYMAENPNLTYTFTIIKNCRSRGILVYSEAEAQWGANVLVAQLPDGSPKFFNHQIGGIRFRPKLFHSEESKAKMSVSSKGQKFTKEAIARRAASRMKNNKPVSEDTRERMSKAKRGVPLKPEHAAKLKATRRGSGNGRARLNEEQVALIISKLDTQTNNEIAAEFNVTAKSIAYIRRGETWKHIPR